MVTIRKKSEEHHRKAVATTYLSLPGFSGCVLFTLMNAGHIAITEARLCWYFSTKKNLWIAVLREIKHPTRRSGNKTSQKWVPTILRLRKTLLLQLKLIEVYPTVPARCLQSGHSVPKQPSFQHMYAS